jgi:hypothetical protein
VRSQTLQGTFSDNGTFKGNIRNAWTVTASKVTQQPPTTEAITSTSTTVTTQSQPGTSVSVAGPPGSIAPRFTEEEFEKALADTLAQNPTMVNGYVGLAVAVVGDCSLYDYAGHLMVHPIPRGQKIRIGDTIVSGSRAGVRIQMADRDEARGSGPSVIYVGADSIMGFGKFVKYLPEHEPVGTGSIVELVQGVVRVFFRGWGRNSSISVKTGATICGIRGSDVFIAHDPRDEKVAASVREGHMDVTSSRTGKTENLTALQSVVVRDGEFGEIHTFTEEQWSSMVKSHGLENMQSLGAEELAELLAQAPTTTSATATTTGFGQTTVTSGGMSGSGPGSTSGTQLTGAMLALIIVLAVVVAVAAGVGIILLRRRRQRANEVAALPGDGAAASPGFCRHCGSAITPGSTFCERCGKRL